MKTPGLTYLKQHKLSQCSRSMSFEDVVLICESRNSTVLRLPLSIDIVASNIQFEQYVKKREN